MPLRTSKELFTVRVPHLYSFALNNNTDQLHHPQALSRHLRPRPVPHPLHLRSAVLLLIISRGMANPIKVATP